MNRHIIPLLFKLSLVGLLLACGIGQNAVEQVTQTEATQEPAAETPTPTPEPQATPTVAAQESEPQAAQSEGDTLPSAPKPGVSVAITRVSVASDGTEANAHSRSPAVSADGRYVVFQSEASNLVANDTNEASDIFVHDRESGEIERVSLASDGMEANGASHTPSISADGRYVAFESQATNLVSENTNGRNNIFVHDRQTGETNLVSVGLAGMPDQGGSYTPAISADGRYVAFASEAIHLLGGISMCTTARPGKPAVFQNLWPGCR